MRPAVADLLASAEASGDEEGVHRGPVCEGIVRQHSETGLGLHRTQRIGDEERLELGIEALRYREHPVWRRKVEDLDVLEHVDPEPEPAGGHRPLLVRHGGKQSFSGSGER